jgi:hypothetical protein
MKFAMVASSEQRTCYGESPHGIRTVFLLWHIHENLWNDYGFPVRRQNSFRASFSDATGCSPAI